MIDHDLFPGAPSSVRIERQVVCAQREVAQRQRVYPRLVASGRMTQAQADEEITIMQAIVETLRGLRR
jgi:hypothetical protein